MGKRKIKCTNSSCKHNIGENGCDTCITIDYSGKCQSFEKGFPYYFHIVWDALGDSNYIDMIKIKMDPDLRIGLYYVMECYGLGFSEMEWGTCRMVMLKDKEDGKGLKYEEIIKREMDMEKFQKFLDDFKKGIMPGPEQKEKEQTNTEPKEFGWLSPTGDFTESPFGTHEESASEICRSKGFDDEYRKWRDENEDTVHLKRDFLQEVKGYCLIHNPYGYGGYIVTNMRDLTKKQKEFLYGYFIDMGDRFKAEQFID